jgi:hypothetical protein
MWKYWVLMFVVLVAVLFYTYVADPCNRLLRTDFSAKYPDYVILDSGARTGSPESVHCQISYRKPGDARVYEDVWVYQYQGTAWQFSKVVETGKRRQ